LADVSREAKVKIQRLAILAVILWVVTAAAAVWFFVKGQTKVEADGRTAILLTETERVAVLAEMRQLLKAVHGVVEGVSHGDEAEGRKQAGQAARSAGMGMATEAGPALLAKLPLAFKQMGMSVHRDFDGLADMITDKATPAQVLTRLAGITARCTTCHDLYRLSAEQSPGIR